MDGPPLRAVQFQRQGGRLDLRLRECVDRMPVPSAARVRCGRGRRCCLEAACAAQGRCHYSWYRCCHRLQPAAAAAAAASSQPSYHGGSGTASQQPARAVATEGGCGAGQRTPGARRTTATTHRRTAPPLRLRHLRHDAVEAFHAQTGRHGERVLAIPPLPRMQANQTCPPLEVWLRRRRHVGQVLNTFPDDMRRRPRGRATSEREATWREAFPPPGGLSRGRARLLAAQPH